MKKNYSRLRFATSLFALAFTTGTVLAGTEPAPVSLTAPTDWLKVSGYANMSYTYTNYNGYGYDDTFADSGANNLDSVKVGFTGTFGNLSAYVSLFYVPNHLDNYGYEDEAGILDAYLTYTMGEFSITGGKFLSYLGYEAFDAVNMSQLTYANGIGAIPAYHTGVKFDYSSDMWGAGLSITDSERGNYEGGFFQGDNDYGDELGYEVYVAYKGVKDLTIWGGIGYEASDESGVNDYVTYDLWASYKVTDKLTVAGEACYNSGAYNFDEFTHAMQYLAFASYAFTDKFSLVGRIGYDDFLDEGLPNFTRYTIAPSYSFDEHFLVRAEVTYTDATNDYPNSTFFGVQGLLKF